MIPDTAAQRAEITQDQMCIECASMYYHSNKIVQGGIRQNFAQELSIFNAGLIAHCPEAHR